MPERSCWFVHRAKYPSFVSILDGALAIDSYASATFFRTATECGLRRVKNSHPRSEKETDHPSPEPGLFVVNDQHQVQVVDISNHPFVRPKLETLLSGLEWIRNPDNHYPIRGTYR